MSILRFDGEKLSLGCMCPLCGAVYENNETVIKEIQRTNPAATGTSKHIAQAYGIFKNIVQSISLEYSLDNCFDTMAGIGITTTLILKYINPKEMLINDLSKFCKFVLSENFKGDRFKVVSVDLKKMKMIPGL